MYVFRNVPQCIDADSGSYSFRDGMSSLTAALEDRAMALLSICLSGSGWPMHPVSMTDWFMLCALFQGVPATPKTGHASRGNSAGYPAART